MTEGQEKSTPQPTIAKWMTDAAEEIENGLWEWIGWDGYECGVAGSFARKAAYSIAANFALRSVAGGEPEQWISVETRLPETSQIVSVASDVGRGVAIFDQHWRPADAISYGCFITNIKWWRPLPAPPQGKEQK